MLEVAQFFVRKRWCRKNVVVALKCSTFSSLMDEAAFKKLKPGEWLNQPPSVVSISVFVVARNENWLQC